MGWDIRIYDIRHERPNLQCVIGTSPIRCIRANMLMRTHARTCMHLGTCIDQNAGVSRGGSVKVVPCRRAQSSFYFQGSTDFATVMSGLFGQTCSGWFRHLPGLGQSSGFSHARIGHAACAEVDFWWVKPTLGPGKTSVALESQTLSRNPKANGSFKRLATE